jgi:hypothetical protein
VYSRRAPQGIGDADLPDETPYICWYTRPSGFAPGLDFPDQAKTLPGAIARPSRDERSRLTAAHLAGRGRGRRKKDGPNA